MWMVTCLLAPLVLPGHKVKKAPLVPLGKDLLGRSVLRALMALPELKA